jgi:hypothetical protein
MARSIISLLILSLGLLASACSDQGSLAPSAGNDQQPAFRAGSSDTTLTPSKKHGPGGSAGGLK